MTSFRRSALFLAAIAVISLAGCDFAPKYQKASVPTPPAYKETAGWKVAQPSDAALRGKWWEIFNDSQLNGYEEQVQVSNQNVAVSAATFLAARALVKQARAQYYPTIGVAPTMEYSRAPFINFGGTSGSGSGSGGSTSGSAFLTGLFAFYELPFDASWQPDFWGKVKNSVRADVFAAQASAADLENVLLTAQAEVAEDYFELRAQDAQKKLLDDTVQAYQDSCDISKERYQAGIDSDEDVAQAETQLESAQAQDTDLGILRAQYEHAIAMLVGKAPADLSIAPEPLASNPPDVPVGLPSALLERRPDIAEAERTMAEMNAQIGVTRAAYYPNISLTAAAGFENISVPQLFTWPSRFFAIGPTASETLFDFGARRGAVLQSQANYDRTVASYRQTVLTAFQQVEDNIAALKVLSDELVQQDKAIDSAQRNLKLANDRYRAGIDPYLNVITAQTTLLTNQRASLTLRQEQMTRSVQLLEALGGGWNANQLPAPNSISHPAPGSGAPVGAQPSGNSGTSVH
jgi:NodT family efflux transporter outer membrane factor (OMF) lipoprotein